jgi:dihydroorotate dehydrogenase
VNLYPLLRALMFRLDPEEAHELVTAQMMRLQRIPLALELARRIYRTSPMVRTVWGLRFPNPLGIAAGFDKNAQLVPFLEALGFGWIEIGTVTLRPQPGNPRPRMFRFREAGAVVNRLGFNNDGAEAVAERLQSLWNSVEQRGTSVEHRPLFVNVGKNKDVPLEGAGDAYAACYERVAPFADGAVLNLSSPNTPGLRDLQRPEHLEAILLRVRSVRDSLQFARPGQHPVLVKIAPDLDDGQLREICDLCVRLADGMSATNTTIDRSTVPTAASEAGGLSGKPLFARSTEVLRRVRELVGPDYPLVGVGGIFTAEDARLKLDAGANLVQAYTGFIYEGPGFASRIVRGLATVK